MSLPLGALPLEEVPIPALVAVFLPAVAAAVLGLVPALRKRGAPAAWVTLGASLLATACAGWLLSNQLREGGTHVWVASWLQINGLGVGDFGVRIDGVSAAMLMVVCVVATCVQIFSIGYMADEEPPAFGRYFTYHALFLFSMNLLVVAPDLMQLFAGWELVGATSYLLIGFYYQKPSAGRAALKAFWITKLADLGFLMALMVLWKTTGAFRWDAALPVATATLVTGLLFFAVVGKSAQFPLHIWLPDAMEGPTPVSALLHAATMVAAGVFLIVRADPLFVQAPQTRDVMLLVGSGTALFAACLALVQTDIKKVLAYSTCSQLGYMVAALGAGSVFGGFFHLSTHAFFKALLFLAAGSVIHGVHSNELADMGGLRKRMPVTATMFILGSMSLAGIPGLAGFFSKDLVLASVEGRFGWAPFAALMATAFLTAFYMGRVVFLAFFGEPRHHAGHAHESGGTLLGPLVILAVPSVALGYFAAPLAHLSGAHYEMHLLGWVPILAASLGLGGFALAWVVYGHGALTVAALKPLERLVATRAVNVVFEGIYKRVLLVLADVLGWFDRYVIDGLMNFIGWSAVAGGRALRHVQTGQAQDYVFAVLAGAIALAAWGLLP
jgi:NADH-quinone oxidoreductase subunit L